MRYQGSEAYSFDVAERRRERVEERNRASFEVVTGGGLDARVREGVSHQFFRRVCAVLAVAAVLFVLGAARVALTAGTSALLAQNADLKSQITEAETLNDDLKITRSVLSSNSRIARIATQNLGMVLASNREVITLEDGTGTDAAQDGASTATDTGTSAAASQADGDAAQSAPEGSQ